MATLSKLPKLLRLKEIEKAATRRITSRPRMSEVEGQGLENLFAGTREPGPMPSPKMPAARPMFESIVNPMPEPGIPQSFPPKPMPMREPGAIDVEPARLMQQGAEFQSLSDLPPEVRKFYGLEDLRYTKQGRVPEAGGELGYAIDAPTREDALAHILGMVKDWEEGGGALKGDLPLKFKGRVHGAPAKVLIKVDPGRGNYGKDKEWFYGIQTTGDFYNSDAKKLFSQWFTPSKTKVSEKETLREILPVRTQSKTVVNSLEEAVAIYDAHISGKESVVGELKKLYKTDKKSYRLEFYKDWIQRSVDKKGWTKENAENKALIKFMNRIDRDESILGLISEHKKMMKAAAKKEQFSPEHRPGVGGGLKKDIERFPEEVDEDMIRYTPEELVIQNQRKNAISLLDVGKRWANPEDIPITSGATTGHETLRNILRAKDPDAPRTRFWPKRGEGKHKTPAMFRNIPEPEETPLPPLKSKPGFKVNPYDIRKLALRKALKKKD